jgi:hypothetical protein
VSSSIELIKSVGEVIVLLSLGGFTAWKAHKADKQTKGTGNGFAAHVKGALADIKDEQRELRGLLTEHLADHAGSDLARSTK